MPDIPYVSTKGVSTNDRKCFLVLRNSTATDVAGAALQLGRSVKERRQSGMFEPKRSTRTM